MTEDQTPEQAVTETVQESPPIDLDALAQKVAEYLKPAPEPPKAPNYEELDYDERDRLAHGKIQELEGSFQALSAKQQAYQKAAELEQTILAEVPEPLRDAALAHVKSSIGQLIEGGNAGLVAGGLNPDFITDIAGVATARAAKVTKTPIMEPKAQSGKSDIPFYDEIAQAYKEAGINATHEMIVKKSETWGNTRAN